MDRRICEFLQIDDILWDNYGYSYDHILPQQCGPDIINLEDVDRVFRSWDSIFEQGSTSTGDETQMFYSSSHPICGSEDTFWSTVQPSYLQLGALDRRLGHCSVSANNLPENVLSSFDVENLSVTRNLPCPLATYCENNGEFELQADDGDIAVVIKSVLNRVNNDNTSNDCKMLKGHSSCKRRRGQLPENSCDIFHGPGQRQRLSDQEFLSSACSAAQPHLSQPSSRRNRWQEIDYSSLHRDYPHTQLDRNLPPNQFPSTEATSIMSSGLASSCFASDKVPIHFTSCIPQYMERSPDPLSKPPAAVPEEKLSKLCQLQQLHSASVAGYSQELAASIGISAFQEKRHRMQCEIEDGCVVEDINFKIPASERASSRLEETSCIKSVFSDDASAIAICIQRLHNVTNQLDNRSRRCIRDSLYHLARSAYQRHDFTNTSNVCRESMTSRNSGGTEESNPFTELTSGSADKISLDQFVTNCGGPDRISLDQFVKNLLFSRIPELAT